MDGALGYAAAGAVVGVLAVALGDLVLSTPWVGGALVGAGLGLWVGAMGGVDATLGRLRGEWRRAAVEVDIPAFGIGRVRWSSRTPDRRVAWAMLVELDTRVTTRMLTRDGLLREAFTSLYDVFRFVRTLVRDAGPEASLAVGSASWLGLELLNRGLAPFLSVWHPRLLAWEAQRREGVGALDHERAWDQRDAAWTALERLQVELRAFVDALRPLAVG